MNLVKGKTYRVTGLGLGWFPVGATIVLGEKSGNIGTYNATGPAIKDGVGALNCKEGDTIKGYVMDKYLEEIVELEEINFSITVTGGKTSFEVLRALTPDEVKRILDIIGG